MWLLLSFYIVSVHYLASTATVNNQPSTTNRQQPTVNCNRQQPTIPVNTWNGYFLSTDKKQNTFVTLYPLSGRISVPKILFQKIPVALCTVCQNFRYYSSLCIGTESVPNWHHILTHRILLVTLYTRNANFQKIYILPEEDFYRVSIKSFPDYKYLLQENYVEYKYMLFFSKCNSTQDFF
jgi:hypothetical protein